MPGMKRFASGRCYYCDTGFNRQPKGRRDPIDTAETEDHVYPKGTQLPSGLKGRDDPKNKVRCCSRCNQDKRHAHPLLWLTLCPSRDGAARLAGLLIELGEDRAKVDAATVKRRRNYVHERQISPKEWGEKDNRQEDRRASVG